MFEIKERDGLARIAEFDTSHGTVETPALMPVINPNKMTISPKRLEDEFGTQILITNSYVIYTDEDLRREAIEKGVHSLLEFSGTIMTDSGTFQAHVYGDIDVEPDEILDFQKKIGSDITTILDRFTEPEDPLELAEEKVDDTFQRAKKAVEYQDEEDEYLSLPLQGSIYPELREESARKIGYLGGRAIYPIGGVVPLMESYRFSELSEIIIASKRGLGPKGPVHLFGAGHPMILPLAVLLGCDLFDSSSYIKYARRGDFMFPTGTKNIDDLEHLYCSCPSCSSYSLKELKSMGQDERSVKIAEHNLWILFKEIDKIKQAIKEESLWELVERRLRAHPHLFESFEILNDRWDFLERYEPRSRKGAILYSGKETLDRPVIKRLKNWIKNEYDQPVDGPTVLFEVDEEKKPYCRYLEDELKEIFDKTSVNLLAKTPLGPIPLEMDETYPIAQSVFPKNFEKDHSLDEFLASKEIDDLIVWDGMETLEHLPENKGISFDEMRIKTIADYQFGKGAGDILSDGKLEFVKNRKGRIKNVSLDGAHILSLRYYDGLFTLKYLGAELLHDNLRYPSSRIKVTEDSAEFNADGKSVFSKFVMDADEDIKPGDEVLIVGPNDDLVAVGRSLLNKEEILEFETGVAAKVREGKNKLD